MAASSPRSWPQAKCPGGVDPALIPRLLELLCGFREPAGLPKGAHEPPRGVFQGVFHAGFEAGIEAPHAALVGKYRNR